MRIEFLKQKKKVKEELKAKKRLNEDGETDEDIESEDCLQEKKVYERMNFNEKKNHMINMWQRAFVKGRAGFRVLNWVNGIKTKILRFGITGKKQIQDIEVISGAI